MCSYQMFSDYLKTARKNAGLTQIQLADKISGLGYQISNGSISYYETDYGKKNKGWSNRPPEEFITVLSRALNLDENEARSRAGYSSATVQHNDILEDLSKLSPEDQNRVKRQIKALISSYIGEETEQQEPNRLTAKDARRIHPTSTVEEIDFDFNSIEQTSKVIQNDLVDVLKRTRKVS